MTEQINDISVTWEGGSALGYHDSLKLSYYWIWKKNVQITKDLPLKNNAEMAKS